MPSTYSPRLSWSCSTAVCPALARQSPAERKRAVLAETGRVRAACPPVPLGRNSAGLLPISPHPQQVPHLHCDTEAEERIEQSFARIKGSQAVLWESRHKDPPKAGPTLGPAGSPPY